jgi:hypothetical protein
VSEHWIHLDEPDLVIAEIRALVMAVNSETVPTTV